MALSCATEHALHSSMRVISRAMSSFRYHRLSSPNRAARHFRSSLQEQEHSSTRGSFSILVIRRMNRRSTTRSRRRFASIHKQVRSPRVINMPHRMFEKQHVMGSFRSSEQSHASLIWCASAFFVIAFDTRCCQVFPRVRAPSRSWNNMIHRQRWSSSAAVGAAHAVAAHDVFSREFNLAKGHT